MKKLLVLIIGVFILIPLVSSANSNLADRLSGRILLQVEEKGEAWYIEPTTKERAFLGRPDDAFRIMRELGLGISEKDFKAFGQYAPKRLSGRILLRVEVNGEAYYVNPVDLKMHFLGRPADAFQVMRNLGLGITNENLDAISIFQNNKTTTAVDDNQTQSINKNTPQVETWEELESQYFKEATQKDWLSLTITNSFGEKRYYRKEGDEWIQKNNEAETLEKYITPPTLEQLSRLRNFCLLLDSSTNSYWCENSTTMESYYTNESFRFLIDDAVNKFYGTLLEQNKQKIIAEEKTTSCLLEITPENERTLDPATQNYLRQLRCGTVTNSDKTSYELSRIKSSLDELKYRLNTKTTFPPVLLDPIPTISQKTSWQIQWTGFGMGRIVYSNGESYTFHCGDNSCQSY